MGLVSSHFLLQTSSPIILVLLLTSSPIILVLLQTSSPIILMLLLTTSCYVGKQSSYSNHKTQVSSWASIANLCAGGHMIEL
jgi:hypothetical protein